MNKNDYQYWKTVAEMTQKERDHFPTFACNFFERIHKKKIQWNWHLDLLSHTYLKAIKQQMDTPIAMRNIRVVIFNVPPRSGKTEFILKLLPLWVAGHEEQIKFISTSYSASMVQATAREARNYWESKEFKATFPWRSELDSSKKAGAWGTKKGLQYYATGSGGSITGFGGDIFNIDDPSKPDEIARTGHELENINAWFGNTVFSRLNPDGLKLIFVIMQRLADNDLCGYLLEEFSEKFQSGEWQHINIPAIAIEDSEYRKIGESFFEDRFSLKDLEQKRQVMNASTGAHYFSAQYQQEPLDIANAEFKKKMFIYILDEGEYVVNGWIGGDIALSEKASADWRSFVVVGKTNKGRFLIQENYLSRKNSSEVMDDLFELQKKWDYPVIIEANGAQKYFANALRKEMGNRNQYFVLKEITARGDKNARLRATLLPLFENLRIIFVRDLEGGELQKEILRFPKSKHDDNMDALETAISGFRDFGAEEEYVEVKDEEWDNSIGFGTNDSEKKSLKKMLENQVKVNPSSENFEDESDWNFF